jgi:aryl-alcohol dehydrogenase-like predicted oxidoreductase
VAKERRLERFVCEQPPYSILVRGIEHDVLPTTLRHGMGVIPWSPLAGGWLSGKYRKGASFRSRRMEYMRERFDHTLPHNARKLEAADELGALADEAGLPLVELALAWVINHPGITAAIVGARTVEHLEGQLPAASRKLDSALLDRIDAIVPPGTNFRAGDDGYDNPALEARARRS